MNLTSVVQENCIRVHYDHVSGDSAYDVDHIFRSQAWYV